VLPNKVVIYVCFRAQKVTWTILTMSLITFRGRKVSIPQEAYGLLWGWNNMRVS